MKGIFTTRINPDYDDRPELRYHFPRTYLRQVELTVGDFIIYYEPGRIGGEGDQRGGRQCYFAVARVENVVPDPARADHYYAMIEPGSFLEFDTPVPFRFGDRTLEASLTKSDGTVNRGAFGRSVRVIDNNEFEAILALGFHRDLPDFIPDTDSSSQTIGIAEEGADFSRPMIEVAMTRPFRDRAFARQVRQAYERTCAFTGLKILNGLGRPEVQAAHIQPVAVNGPDSVRNGLALSSTFHWLFDRGLLSLDNDFRILIAHNKVPEGILAMINRDGFARVPESTNLRPDARYLSYHRDHVFKG